MGPDEIYISVRQGDGEYHGIFLQLIKIKRGYPFDWEDGLPN